MQNGAAVPNPGAGGQAKVKYGVLDTNIPTTHGLTVDAIKNNYQSQWSMPADVEPRVGGQKVDDNYVLQANDMLEFHRRSGEKG